MILKGKDIIIIGLQPWYTDIGSNCKNLALQFARYNRVLYVNIPLNRNTLLRKKRFPELEYHFEVLNSKQEALVKVQDNLWNYYPLRVHESINWLSSRALFGFFNRINNGRFAADIREAAESLGFRNYVLFNDNDIFRGFYLKELLQPELYIYYCRDYLRGVDYFSKHAEWLEPLHIAKADIGVANSIYLTQYLKKHNINSHYIGQGCNLSLFNADEQYGIPADIRPTGSPVIGYAGALTTMRLDIDVLLHIAVSKPEWQLVLVGPEDEKFKSSALHNLPNVYFTGKKDISKLPEYISTFDVCINPQLVNPLTIGNYPLKVDEYLAMGKPVVATATEAMSMFRPFSYLAGSKEDYIRLIEKAMQENNDRVKQQRIAFARSHTWERSAETLYSCIQQNHKFKPNPITAQAYSLLN